MTTLQDRKDVVQQSLRDACQAAAAVPLAHQAVRRDAGRLGQVRGSLLDNAVKYTPCGERSHSEEGPENEPE